MVSCGRVTWPPLMSVAGLNVPGLNVAGLDVAGLDVAGLDVAGLIPGLNVPGLNVTVQPRSYVPPGRQPARKAPGHAGGSCLPSARCCRVAWCDAASPGARRVRCRVAGCEAGAMPRRRVRRGGCARPAPRTATA